MLHRRQSCALRPVLAVVIGSAGAARADLKIVSTVTTSGSRSGGATTSTVTTYYKGTWTRTETPENVLIVDRAAGKIYSLNPAQKTYSVLSLSDLGKNPMIAMMDMKTTVSLKPGGQTKTILGKPAKNYVYTAVLQMSLKKEALQRMQAMNASNSATTPKPPTIPPVTIKGVSWVTEAVKAPSGASSSTAMATLSQIPGMKALVEQFSSIHGVPLEQEMNVTTTAQGGINQTRITKATTIDEKPLPDSLFTIPADYHQMTRSMMPGMPAGGGAGAPPRGPSSTAP